MHSHQAFFNPNQTNLSNYNEMSRENLTQRLPAKQTTHNKNNTSCSPINHKKNLTNCVQMQTKPIQSQKRNFSMKFTEPAIQTLQKTHEVERNNENQQRDQNEVQSIIECFKKKIFHKDSIIKHSSFLNKTTHEENHQNYEISRKNSEFSSKDSEFNSKNSYFTPQLQQTPAYHNTPIESPIVQQFQIVHKTTPMQTDKTAPFQSVQPKKLSQEFQNSKPLQANQFQPQKFQKPEDPGKIQKSEENIKSIQNIQKSAESIKSSGNQFENGEKNKINETLKQNPKSNSAKPPQDSGHLKKSLEERKTVEVKSAPEPKISGEGKQVLQQRLQEQDIKDKESQQQKQVQQKPIEQEQKEKEIFRKKQEIEDKIKEELEKEQEHSKQIRDAYQNQRKEKKFRFSFSDQVENQAQATQPQQQNQFQVIPEVSEQQQYFTDSDAEANPEGTPKKKTEAKRTNNTPCFQNKEFRCSFASNRVLTLQSDLNKSYDDYQENFENLIKNDSPNLKGDIGGNFQEIQLEIVNEELLETDKKENVIINENQQIMNFKFVPICNIEESSSKQHQYTSELVYSEEKTNFNQSNYFEEKFDSENEAEQSPLQTTQMKQSKGQDLFRYPDPNSEHLMQNVVVPSNQLISAEPNSHAYFQNQIRDQHSSNRQFIQTVQIAQQDSFSHNNQNSITCQIERINQNIAQQRQSFSQHIPEGNRTVKGVVYIESYSKFEQQQPQCQDNSFPELRNDSITASEVRYSSFQNENSQQEEKTEISEEQLQESELRRQLFEQKNQSFEQKRLIFEDKADVIVEKQDVYERKVESFEQEQKQYEEKISEIEYNSRNTEEIYDSEAKHRVSQKQSESESVQNSQKFNFDVNMLKQMKAGSKIAELLAEIENQNKTIVQKEQQAKEYRHQQLLLTPRSLEKNSLQKEFLSSENNGACPNQQDSSSKLDNSSNKQDYSSNHYNYSSNKQDEFSLRQDHFQQKQEILQQKQDNSALKQDNSSRKQDNSSRKQDNSLFQFESSSHKKDNTPEKLGLHQNINSNSQSIVKQNLKTQFDQISSQTNQNHNRCESARADFITDSHQQIFRMQQVKHQYDSQNNDLQNNSGEQTSERGNQKMYPNFHGSQEARQKSLSCNSRNKSEKKPKTKKLSNQLSSQSTGFLQYKEMIQVPK